VFEWLFRYIRIKWNIGCKWLIGNFRFIRIKWYKRFLGNKRFI
jgi:hypothetical protein